MILADIQASIYRRFNYLGNPLPQEITGRVTEYINQTHRELCAMPGMDKLRDDVMSVTAYNGIARTGLPPIVARINASLREVLTAPAVPSVSAARKVRV